MSGFVYILQCSDGSYYTGSTSKPMDERLAEHNAGRFPGYTASRRPVRLLFVRECANLTDAHAAERQIKGWSRRKKEALIAGEFDRLKDFASRKSVPRPSRAAARPPQDDG